MMFFRYMRKSRKLSMIDIRVTGRNKPGTVAGMTGTSLVSMFNNLNMNSSNPLCDPDYYMRHFKNIDMPIEVSDDMVLSTSADYDNITYVARYGHNKYRVVEFIKYDGKQLQPVHEMTPDCLCINLSDHDIFPISFRKIYGFHIPTNKFYKIDI